MRRQPRKEMFLNPPMVDENTLMLCIGMATMAGALLGFALGYGIKEKRHAKEIAAMVRITRRVHQAPSLQKEKAN